MANLMLVQCVIASHAEVWTSQFGATGLSAVCDCGIPDHTHLCKFYQELTVTMVHVPEGTAVSTQGQHYVQ